MIGACGVGCDMVRGDGCRRVCVLFPYHFEGLVVLFVLVIGLLLLAEWKQSDSKVPSSVI